MREWYEIDFTPDSALKRSKHYESVTDLMINGQLMKNYETEIINKAIDKFIKECDKHLNFDETKHPKNGYVVSRCTLFEIAEKLKEVE